ncbi:MAG: HEAT repeat domain-containing protein [Candidatus Eremiobacteraeota bacterium]|nr:HEAT repeat domain-containing protein [Candidatus Eremiobacteraeota bacterium]
MKLPDLLEQLRATHHQGRIQRMLELGRRAAAEPEVAELLRTMSGKGFYLRHMALFAALAARDGEAFERTALRDPSRILRRMALRMAAKICSDEQLMRLLDELSGKELRLVVVSLQKRHRPALLERWLLSQAKVPTELLGFAGEEFLDKHREQLLERGSACDWTRVTRRHPGWAAAHVLQKRTGHSIQQLQATLIELAEQRHPETLPLWHRAREADYTTQDLPESVLFRQFPRPLSDWALEQSEGGPAWAFEAQAPRLTLEQCRQMVERGWIHLSYTWWKRRSVEERALLFTEGRDAIVAASGAIAARFIAGLPHEKRVPEARRQSLLPVHQIEPRLLVEFLAMLGFEEGSQTLLILMQNPDVEIRALGLRGFTQMGRYQPDCRSQVLQTLITRQNEADPVRSAFLDELANLPPGGWNPTHFKALGEILKAGLNAADASPYTFASMERLILRLLPFQPAWSAPWLAKLLRHRGQTSVHGWEPYLQKPGSAEALDEDLSGVLRDWMARERFSAVWGLVNALGKRLPRLQGVLKLCQELCDHPQSGVAEPALQTLARYASPVCHELIPRLVQADSSWFQVSCVRRFVHRYRQDLLDLILSEAIVRGKFASGLTGWVITFEDGFWRWAPDQQFRYSERLGDLLHDPEASFPTVRACLRSLARLPAVPPTLLQEFGALSEERLAVRDEAVRALARMDAGQGVPFLMDCLEDDRGRIAIYALRRVFLEIPVASALEQLKSISSARITVQKEVVRLLGDLPRAVGLPAVLERLEADGLHRDVHLACLRGLWEHLDEDRVWPALNAAALSQAEAVGQQLAVIQVGRHGAEARARVNGLLLKLLGHPSIRVRLAVMNRLVSQPVEDPENLLLEPVLAILSQSGEEGERAASVLWRKFAQDAEGWGQLVSQHLSDRQALVHLLRAFSVGLVIYNVQRARIRPHLLATIEALAADPATLKQRLELAAYRLSLAEFLEMVEAQPQHWDVVLNWASFLRQHAFKLEKTSWETIWERWNQHSDAHLRRLSLESLLVHTAGFGWSEQSRQRLRHFQQDDSDLVTGRAQFVFPPPL